MRRTIAACFLLFPLLSQQRLPDAKELVKKSAETLTTHRSYQFDTEIIFDIETGGVPIIHTSLTSSLAVVNPDKKWSESKGQMGETTIVSDGEFTWVYVPTLKQYTKKAAMRDPQAIIEALGIGNLTDLSKGLGDPKTLREESLEIDGRKYPCWVVETRIDKVKLPQPEGAELTDCVMTLWIDKDLKIDRQLIMSAKMQGGPITAPMDIKQKIIKRGIRFNVDLPDSLFRFTPPQGATEVSEFAIPGMKSPNMVGKHSPAFRVKSLAGEAFDLASLKGKVVLLDFWATWCGPCRRELPTTEKIHQELKASGLVVLGLNVGEDRETVEKFLKTVKVSYPVALTLETGVPESFEVDAYPTYVVIDREGNIVAYQVGSAGEAGLREALSKAGLGGKPGK